LPKPQRLRRFSISDARFALFNIKRDIAAALEFFLKPLAMLERRVPQAVINSDDLFTAIWAKRFLAADLAAVRIVSRSARSTIGRALAIIINKLGNGWIYVILGVITFQCVGREGLPS
jgi:hypothetical protein